MTCQTSFLVFSVSASVYRGLVDVGVIGEEAGRRPEAEKAGRTPNKKRFLPASRVERLTATCRNPEGALD